jgi:hypothetical protein
VNLLLCLYVYWPRIDTAVIYLAEYRLEFKCIAHVTSKSRYTEIIFNNSLTVYRFQRTTKCMFQVFSVSLTTITLPIFCDLSFFSLLKMHQIFNYESLTMTVLYVMKQ